MRWNDILQEIMNKKNNNQTRLSLTSVAEQKAKVISSDKPRTTIYSLGPKFTGIYFTQREAECMLCFLMGRTIATTAEVLHLSPRTIEYYVKNMRNKLNCRTKSELIGLVLESDFVKNIG